jgi:hypothetical protein
MHFPEWLRGYMNIFSESGLAPISTGHLGITMEA